jgi:hypothetical protein
MEISEPRWDLRFQCLFLAYSTLYPVTEYVSATHARPAIRYAISTVMVIVWAVLNVAVLARIQALRNTRRIRILLISVLGSALVVIAYAIHFGDSVACCIAALWATLYAVLVWGHDDFSARTRYFLASLLATSAALFEFPLTLALNALPQHYRIVGPVSIGAFAGLTLGFMTDKTWLQPNVCCASIPKRDGRTLLFRILRAAPIFALLAIVLASGDIASRWQLSPVRAALVASVVGISITLVQAGPILFVILGSLDASAKAIDHDDRLGRKLSIIAGLAGIAHGSVLFELQKMTSNVSSSWINHAAIGAAVGIMLALSLYAGVLTMQHILKTSPGRPIHSQ